MTEPIAPALTAAEWAALESQEHDVRLFRHHPRTDELLEVGLDCWDYGSSTDKPADRHAIAALALHGQPFGFTRADVALVRGVIADVDHGHGDGCFRGPCCCKDRMGRLFSLADRIEALLPPEAGTP